MKDFLIETSSQRKEINWNKISSFYQNNNSSLIDACCVKTPKIGSNAPDFVCFSVKMS
jgi:hypothetical protein